MTSFDPQQGLDQEPVNIAAKAIEDYHTEAVVYRQWAHGVLERLVEAGFTISREDHDG
jgi:hypothetical protein